MHSVPAGGIISFWWAASPEISILRTRDRSVRPTRTARIWNFLVCAGVGPRGSFAEHGDVHGRKSASGPWRGSRASHSTSDYHRSLSRTRGSKTVFGAVTGHDDRSDRCAAYWRALGRRDGVAGDFLVPRALWRCVARGSAQDRARDARILTPCDCGPPRHLARLYGAFQARQARGADPFKRFPHGGAVCLYRLIVVCVRRSFRPIAGNLQPGARRHCRRDGDWRPDQRAIVEPLDGTPDSCFLDLCCTPPAAPRSLSPPLLWGPEPTWPAP